MIFFCFSFSTGAADTGPLAGAAADAGRDLRLGRAAGGDARRRASCHARDEAAERDPVLLTLVVCLLNGPY